MKTVAMSGSLRANVGKKDAQALRRNEQVPCVLYGGNEQVTFAVPEAQFRPLVFTPDVHAVELTIGDKKHVAILKEIQQNPVNDRIVHADFIEVVEGKDINIGLPIKLVGNSAGVKAGGKLIKKLRKLNVRGPLTSMPDNITINIEKLDIGQNIRVADVNIDGLSLTDAGNLTIVTIQVTRNVAAAATDDKAKGAAKAPAAKAAAPAAKAPAAKK
jgi:large subunit ribosomal protein L25